MGAELLRGSTVFGNGDHSMVGFRGSERNLRFYKNGQDDGDMVKDDDARKRWLNWYKILGCDLYSWKE